MRKFLTTLLCLIMVFTMMPMATGVAFADEPESYNLCLGEEEVTSENTSGERWEFVTGTDANTIKLIGGDIGFVSYTDSKPLKIYVVSDTNILADGESYNGIYSQKADVNITIDKGASLTIGTITDIASLTNEDVYNIVFGMNLCNNASITNNGTLNIYSKNCGISLHNQLHTCDLSIINNGNINMYSSCQKSDAAIVVAGNLTIDATTNTNSLIINSGIDGIFVNPGNATLTNVNATITGLNGSGISIDNGNKLTIGGNANINAYGGENAGINAGPITIEGAAKVNAKSEGCGITSDSLIINGEDVKVDASGAFAGINANSFKHINGITNVCAPIGIMSAGGNIDLLGGKVTTTSTDVNIGMCTVSAGIYALMGTLNIPSNSDCVIKTTATATNSNLMLGIGGTKINIEEGFSGSIEATVYAEVPISNTNAFAPIASGMPPGIGGEYPPTLDTASITDTLTFEVSSSTDTNTNLEELDNLASLTDGVSKGLYKYVKIAPKKELPGNLPVTIASMLATVPDSFPTESTSKKYWKNENGISAYISDDNLVFNGGSICISLTTELTKDATNSNKYTCVYPGMKGNVATFNINNGVLESIEIAGLFAGEAVGKYVAPEPAPTPSYHGSGYFDYEAYKANLEKLEKEEHGKQVAEVKEAVKSTEFKATSTKQTKLNGKKAVKIKWEVVDGTYSLSDFEGFDVFRSTKKYSGYGKTPFFTTKNWTYTNNKDLKEGKTYYYKVRAWKMVDGEKVYTGWSTKAWRTVK